MIYNGDCLEIMKILPDQSVDMILTDLPYGVTGCAWDEVIPFEPLWEQYTRLIKEGGATVLFAAQPFTTKLINSNLPRFHHAWVWQKDQGRNFQCCKTQPLKIHEDIVCFGTTPRYYPQGLVRLGKSKPNKGKSGNLKHLSGSEELRDEYIQEFCNYPSTILKFNSERGEHPTQKPVELLKYLIKTYTKEKETVLDSCMGSGSTGVAAAIAGREFIGIEKDEIYFELAKRRIENASKMADYDEEQLSLDSVLWDKARFKET